MQWYPAPAKLNLFLHVLGRREDGYHLLQTVFRLVDLQDEVGVALRTDGVIQRVDTTPGVGVDEDLCVRAARLLQGVARQRFGAATADALGADLGLRKHIPIGGGLGGGSSNAATVLLVLNRLWQLDLKRSELMALGLTLGADVPLFVFGQNALGEGVGERLQALILPAASYLILRPQVSVSTKEIFSSAALTRDTKALKIPPFFPGLGKNDLQPVATALYPDIAQHLNWLEQHGAKARMSGSGSCVFAQFDQLEQAAGLAAQLPKDMLGFVAQGLAEHPLRAWLKD